MDEAIKTADFVVIPTLSSPIDLQQTMLTAAQCQDAGKDYAVLIVMARKGTNALRAFRTAVGGIRGRHLRHGNPAEGGFQSRFRPHVQKQSQRIRGRVERAEGGTAMKKASGRLTMSMQPRRELEGKPVTRLMDVQDNTGRGDSETVRKVMTTFQMDADLKAELKRYCADNGMKMGETINQAIEQWLQTK